MSMLRFWPIMEQLEQDFLDNVKSFMVIGKQSDGVLMVTKDGKLYWFGWMRFGSQSRQAKEPTQLLIFGNVTSMAQGDDHIFLLTSMGVCLVLGKLKSSPTFGPVNVPSSLKFSSIQCGPEHCVALGEDKNVYCWERYHSNNLTQSQFWFTQVPAWGTDRIVAIACGEYHALALSEQGKVFGWNNCRKNKYHLKRTDPTQISANNCMIKSIACGKYRCLLLTTKGEVYCCGENNLQSLNEKDWMATLVSGLPSISQIAAHYATNLWTAMSNDKTVYVLGQFEDGTDIRTSIKFNSKSILAPLTINSSQSNYPYLMSMKELSQFITEDQAPSRLPHRLAAMFDNPATGDVQFVVDQKTIHAHRCFLRVSSDYFSKLLSETWLPTKPNEPLDPILIEDYCYSVFYAYLRFLYTGTFQVSEDNLIEFFDLASCYLEGELCQMSLDQMQASISVPNCSLYYELTDRHQVPEFEQFVVKFISDHIFQVFCTETYRAMKPELCKKLSIAIGDLELIKMI